MPTRTVSDEFNDSYAEQGLQPSVGTRDVIKHSRVEYAKGDGNTSARADRSSLSRGFRVQKSAENKNSKTGLAFGRSRTGNANRSDELATANSSRRVRNNTRGTKLLRPAGLDKAKIIKNRVVATRTSLMILSWSIPLWFTLQLPLSILALIAFAGAGTASEFLPAWLVQWVGGGVFEILQISVFFIGLGTLIVMGIIYALSGVRGFFGEGSHLKGPIFCLAVVGYLLPFTNIFPWFIFWALAVWRYPK